MFKSKAMGIKGNYTTDNAFQNGGALIVDKNGNQLYEFIQDDPTEYITGEEILRALKIQENTRLDYLKRI